MVKRTPWWLLAVTVLSACAADFGSDEDEDDGGEVSDDTGVAVEDGRLYINEFMASNGSLAVDGDDDEATPDWIEIYNAGTFDVDLAGFWVSDDLDEPAKAVLGSLVVPAQGHVVLLADGGDGGAHLPFKLDADGDALGLFDPEGQPLDRITFGGQLTDVAAGRAPDGGALGFLPEPTPGEANPSELRE
jgi:hypothetical protein